MTEWAWILVTGAISSIVASSIFILVLALARPDIRVSTKIVRQNIEGEIPEYRIKILNNGRFAIVNIRAELSLVRRFNGPSGMYKSTHRLSLAKSELMILRRKGTDPLSEDHDYAFRFVIEDDVDGIWDDSHSDFLRFSIYAEHSFSGFSKVHSMMYHSKADNIVTGAFKIGPSLEIVPRNQ